MSFRLIPPQSLKSTEQYRVPLGSSHQPLPNTTENDKLCHTTPEKVPCRHSTDNCCCKRIRPYLSECPNSRLDQARKTEAYPRGSGSVSRIGRRSAGGMPCSCVAQSRVLSVDSARI